MKAVVLLAIVALLAAPSAQAAAELQAILDTGHPADHKIKVPESRRVQVPLNVKLEGKEFVCATKQTFAVNPVINYDAEWAGVSITPPASTVEIPQGAPGANLGSWTGSTVNIDVFWGENRPKTGAEITYTITVDASNIAPDEAAGGGPCLPTPDEKSFSTQITFFAEDIVEAANTTGPDCLHMPDDPACIDPTEPSAPPAEAPGIAPFIALSALATVIALRRRTQ